jgi:hypothetical protein
MFGICDEGVICIDLVVSADVAIVMRACRLWIMHTQQRNSMGQNVNNEQ